MAKFFDMDSIIGVIEGMAKKNNFRFAEKKDLNNYLPRPQEVNFTIPVSDWTLDNEKYFADVNISGLTANDTAEIYFDKASESIIANADLSEVGETLSGKIRLYAENIPADSVSGTASITKAAQE